MRQPRLFLCLFLLAATTLALGLATPSLAHPIPDIPVKAHFEEDGSCLFRVEVDPRCFDSDPEIAPYLLHSALKTLPEDERIALLTQAGEYVARAVEFYFEPSGRFTPAFTFEFSSLNNAPLEKDEDPVVMTGVWRSTVPAGATGYRLRAAPEGTLSVLFINHYKGRELERSMVLFPKESSFTLDLANPGASESSPAAPQPGSGAAAESGSATSRVEPATTMDSFLAGLHQFVRDGPGHIVFVLALFFFSRSWRVILQQAGSFVVAHSLTLWAGVAGWLHVPDAVVGSAAAAGIVVLSVENVIHPRFSLWRQAAVVLFGLVHGLAFANAFAVLKMPPESFPATALGFQAGLEVAMLGVLAIAGAVSSLVRSPMLHRFALAIPVSVACALVGLWWMAQKAGWPVAAG